MLATRSSLLAAATVVVTITSCGPHPGPRRGPVATSLAVAPPPGDAPTAADALRAPAPLEPIAFDPDALAALRDSARLPALVLRSGEVPASLTAIALRDTARAEARGLTASGGVRYVVLGEGQRAAMPIDLRPADCVTVVVHAGLGVREVDAFVIAPAAPDGQVLAQETTGGPLAIIGGRGGCFRAAMSGTGEVVVVARKGAGPILVAVYVAGAPAPGATGSTP